MDPHTTEACRNWLSEIREWAGRRPQTGDTDDWLEERPEPLSIRVRSPWLDNGTKLELPLGEYEILLATGGPAVRLISTLDEDSETVPVTAFMEGQNWFEPWERFTDASAEDSAAILLYVQSFYYYTT